MRKWYEKVNKYAYSVAYLYFVDRKFSVLIDDKNYYKGDILIKKSWRWLEDHNSVEPNEIYKLYSGDNTLKEIVDAANAGIDLEPTDYGSIPDWSIEATSEQNQDLWGLLGLAAGSVIYSCYNYHKEWAPGDCELPPDLTAEYWSEGGEGELDWLYSKEEKEKLINWLIENYPPGTEEKPVYKKEVLELFK